MLKEAVSVITAKRFDIRMFLKKLWYCKWERSAKKQGCAFWFLFDKNRFLVSLKNVQEDFFPS